MILHGSSNWNYTSITSRGRALMVHISFTCLCLFQYQNVLTPEPSWSHSQATCCVGGESGGVATNTDLTRVVCCHC